MMHEKEICGPPFLDLVPILGCPPHPQKVHNFARGLDVGQVSAVAVNPNDQPVIFHRGPTVWNQ